MLLICPLFLNTGVAGKSPNFYVYAHNSPILVKDPTGRIIPVIAVAAGYIAKRAAMGALASVAVYYATSEITGTDTTLGGNMILHTCILDSWKSYCYLYRYNALINVMPH